MPGALGTLAPLLDYYGYPAVAGLIQSYALAALGVFAIVLIVRHVVLRHHRRETTKR